MRKFITLFLVFSFICMGVGGLLLFSFVNVPADKQASEVVFEVPPGSSLYSVARRLSEDKLVSNQKFFYWYGRLLGYAGKIKEGEYHVSAANRPLQILEVISSGQSITYPVTVPEGYNIFEIAEILEKLWAGRGQSFLTLVRDPNVVKEILGESQISLEGYLFPDTYVITKYTSMRTLVEMMVSRFKEEFSNFSNLKQTEMSKHEIITLASVVEKETGAPEERPRISSVFHNRLKKGMRLQSDPTIIYGKWVETGSALSNIRKSDITGFNPYNTYTVNALPAGPIANPGRDAIRAVLNPEETEFLYFVSRNDGTHIFTSTYEDHLKAVKSFQLNQDARKGKSWRDLKDRKKN